MTSLCANILMVLCRSPRGAGSLSLVLVSWGAFRQEIWQEECEWRCK